MIRVSIVLPLLAACAAPRPRGPVLDAHHLGPDDFFVLEDAYRSGTASALVAEQLSAPPGPGAEGEYLDAGGRRLWTRFRYRTRVATAADVQPGAMVITTAPPPADRAAARRAAWTLVTLTEIDHETLRAQAVRVILPE